MSDVANQLFPVPFRRKREFSHVMRDTVINDVSDPIRRIALCITLDLETAERSQAPRESRHYFCIWKIILRYRRVFLRHCPSEFLEYLGLIMERGASVVPWSRPFLLSLSQCHYCPQSCADIPETAVCLSNLCLNTDTSDTSVAAERECHGYRSHPRHVSQSCSSPGMSTMCAQ